MSIHRPQHHIGRIGDTYRIVDAAGANLRSGSGDYPTLRIGDILMRLDHCGDYFSSYAVIRAGVRLEKAWSGYEFDLEAVLQERTS